jgi:hypothetical protein
VRPLARQIEEPLAEAIVGECLIADHERVSQVLADRIVPDPDRDVGHGRLRLELGLGPLDQVSSGETEPGLIQAGDQNL